MQMLINSICVIYDQLHSVIAQGLCHSIVCVQYLMNMRCCFEIDFVPSLHV